MTDHCTALMQWGDQMIATDGGTELELGELEQEVGVPGGQGDRLQVILNLFMFKKKLYIP